jgi:hypothetical protein
MFEILSTIREARKIAIVKGIEKKEAAQKKKIAKIFNDRYTYNKEYLGKGEWMPSEGNSFYGFGVKKDYAWMCPDCNKIHRPTGCTVFTGLQYPACCSYYQGDRLYAGIKTP